MTIQEAEVVTHLMEPGGELCLENRLAAYATAAVPPLQRECARALYAALTGDAQECGEALGAALAYLPTDEIYRL